MMVISFLQAQYNLPLPGVRIIAIPSFLSRGISEIEGWANFWHPHIVWEWVGHLAQSLRPATGEDWWTPFTLSWGPGGLLLRGKNKPEVDGPPKGTFFSQSSDSFHYALCLPKLPQDLLWRVFLCSSGWNLLDFCDILNVLTIHAKEPRDLVEYKTNEGGGYWMLQLSLLVFCYCSSPNPSSQGIFLSNSAHSQKAGCDGESIWLIVLSQESWPFNPTMLDTAIGCRSSLTQVWSIWVLVREPWIGLLWELHQRDNKWKFNQYDLLAGRM